MKIETYNRLNKFDSYLNTASKANYIRSLTNSQMEELIAIGAELGIHHVNNHCPKCALEFVKKLATPYFEHKRLMEEKDNEGNETKEPKRNGKKTPDNRGNSKR